MLLSQGVSCTENTPTIVYVKRSSHLNRFCIVGCLSISVKSLDGQPKAKTNSSTGRTGYSVFLCWRKGQTGHIMQVVQACLHCRGLKCYCQRIWQPIKKQDIHDLTIKKLSNSLNFLKIAHDVPYLNEIPLHFIYDIKTKRYQVSRVSIVHRILMRLHRSKTK